jgi:hypothetical protein
MTDYSTAATNASDALEDVAEGLIEEYEIRTNGRRVKRGKAIDQIKAAAMLQGLAHRQSSGAICNVAKFANPR